MGNEASAPVTEVVVETVPAEEAPVAAETKAAPQANPDPESVPEASGIVDLDTEDDCEGRKSACANCVIS
eukprot:CAMPEP_0116037880 /NCGR_PEP_ID=MMETSP0321-20121206/22367_1 /TAXON_ID=163516 /ORGANISM="Leptocylindrus danicus var. danicus, Strain B650" /LENGTH=69 /DNA_ID=CAMNT_0003516269 /DNA_START=52 /DNA_END=261 /DNA_ORIENTATION=+